MSFSEIFVLILLVITLFSFCIFLFKKFYKSKSNIERIEKDLKIYYDDEFKKCVEILSNRLLKNEFEKVCLLLCNLREGYDYGFNDSINYAFYKEIKKIRGITSKKRVTKIVKFNK